MKIYSSHGINDVVVCLGYKGHLEGTRVRRFVEKPPGDGGWMDGGFFVGSPKVCDSIDGDDTTREREPLERLSPEEQVCASGNAPWKI